MLAGLLAALSPDFAIAQVVPQGDPRITTERIDVDSPNGSGKVKAYLAKPAKASGKLPISNKSASAVVACFQSSTSFRPSAG